MPGKEVLGPTGKTIKINGLRSEVGLLGPTTQMPLFKIEKQAEIDGVEMGVLENGMPYLTERGVARMCGIDRRVLNRLAVGWADEMHKPRGRAIAQLLEQSGYVESYLYLESEHKGLRVNAYTEPVCLALLEYYAFVAEDTRPEAVRAFRALARITFRKFIYDAVGYAPESRQLDAWQHFHDRVDLTHDATPGGYWGVFREIAMMIVPMIRNGIIISDRVIPDISVGRAWSEHWKQRGLSQRYGDRARYDHAYPDYYPQSKSNPQPSYAYPNASLGEFREWLVGNYITTKLPKYLLGQTSKNILSIETANKTLAVFGAPKLTYSPKRPAIR